MCVKLTDRFGNVVQLLLGAADQHDREASAGKLQKKNNKKAYTSPDIAHGEEEH